MGMVMPRHAGLTEDVTGRIEDFVVILLLPLFFAYTGLRTNIGLLDRPELWLLTLALIAVAIVGKLAGAYIAARVVGMTSKPAAVIGTLMNTRGLTELIVLNLALEAGVISEALFASLVLMALVTTFMAGPMLRLIDRENEYGAPVEEEFEEARKESQSEFPALEVPDRSILLAPQDPSGLPQLLALAEPMARSEPPREVILARPVSPPRSAAAGVRGGLQTENRLLEDATAQVHEARDRLVAQGIAARAVAFISPDPAADVIRVADRENVDIVLVDGRRPLLGEGVPRGEVGVVLRDTPCDVAVVVAREDQKVEPGPESSVVVPFGGAEHDWAALELGAWIASATNAPLRLLGAAGETEETSKVSRLLADAGLLVQQYAGVPAEPVIAEPGGVSVIEAAESAGLLVIGLSARWREEGLGPTRSEIAKAAPAPIAFVRRGSRPGALAPSDEFTHFTWSSPGMVPAREELADGFGERRRLKRCDRRGHRRRLRLAARLHDRGLPRLRPRADRDLRRGLEPRRHLPAVRLEPRPDDPALRVRVALPAGRLADLRPARRLGAQGPLSRSCARPGASSTPACRRSSPRPRSSPACSATRTGCIGGRHVGWVVREPGPPPYFSLYDDDAELLGPRQAPDARRRPRPALLPRRLRRGPREPRDGGPHRPGLRAEAVLPRRALHRRRLRDRGGQRVGQRHRRRRLSASRCSATPSPRSRT